MRVLSVQQPWAWAILHAGKTVENRTWGTAYRGPLLIHAGKSRERLGDFAASGLAGVCDVDEPAAAGLTFGAVVGVVDLVGCKERSELELTGKDACWAEGPWCWLLENPRPLLSPIPLAGRMGLWVASGTLVAAVNAQLCRTTTASG